MALDVTVYIAEARRGEPSILFSGRRRTPAEAAELARDLMAAADFAITLDGTASEGVPDDDDAAFTISVGRIEGGPISAEVADALLDTFTGERAAR